MKQIFAAAAATTMAFGFATPALADNHKEDWKAQSPEVVETNAQGKATKVKIGDKVYDVCMKNDQDGCINPRAAGLNWGNRPLTYWPGQPASSM